MTGLRRLPPAQGYGQAAAATAKGLWVTLKTLFRPAVTVQYPREKLAPAERFRGVLLFDFDACIACGRCAKACPSACIALKRATDPAGKPGRGPAWYSVDVGKCQSCRLCEESCPTEPKSVWHSLDYELLFSCRDEMVRLWSPEFSARPKDLKPEDEPAADTRRRLAGRWYDRGEKAFKEPRWQLAVQSMPVRHDKQCRPREDK